MTNKLKLTTIALTALLLSACGGGSSDGGTSNPINDKKFVIILTEVQLGICESDAYRAALSSEGFQDFITEETENTTSCETYGKTNDGETCGMELLGEGNKNCVIGFESFRDLSRRTAPLNLHDRAEILSASF